mmetsp:Transcript_33839/g.72155  ORF Transcript_33839/g.72155 Transcript_33839/m.72155 type:complete len:244 (-) Transcript_33839:456-1187(-)
MRFDVSLSLPLLLCWTWAPKDANSMQNILDIGSSKSSEAWIFLSKMSFATDPQTLIHDKIGEEGVVIPSFSSFPMTVHRIKANNASLARLSKSFSTSAVNNKLPSSSASMSPSPLLSLPPAKHIVFNASATICPAADATSGSSSAPSLRKSARPKSSSPMIFREAASPSSPSTTIDFFNRPMASRRTEAAACSSATRAGKRADAMASASIAVTSFPLAAPCSPFGGKYLDTKEVSSRPKSFAR